MSSDEAEYMRRMADALRSGAKMLADQCPVCNSPLFEIKGQIWCLKCNKRVIRVSSEEEVEEAFTGITLNELLKTLTTKMEEVNIALKRVADPREIKDLTETLISLLKALELASNLREHFTD
ncbi:MAG: Sjogren's syndrome/scleroderma autoantigen 1 family protein [Nitrososphaerota archaeon]